MSYLNNTKFRLLGYYNFPNQVMNPETERTEEAQELAPLLELSIQSLYDNPYTDDDLRKVITTPAVFVFKSEEDNLYAFYTKDKTARITGVVYNRKDITQVPLKYKAWFYPGQPIDLGISEYHEITSGIIDRKGQKTDKRDSTYRHDSSKEIKLIRKNWKLKDDCFIGQIRYVTKDGVQDTSRYTVIDIRRSDFSKINTKVNVAGLNDNLDIPHYNRYYKFSWILSPNSTAENPWFYIDTKKPVTLFGPEAIIGCIHDDIIDYPASASQIIVKTLDTLKNQLTASGKEVFIYELLQNANDYPSKKNGKDIPVNVEFRLTKNYLVFQHTGAYFSPRNIAAICSINDKEKTDNTEAIGYKGIGFKTVFLDNNYVYLRTGDYSFRFDWQDSKDIQDVPWQILPIWTPFRSVDSEIQEAFNAVDPKEFKVQFALRPTKHSTLYESDSNFFKLFSEVFDTERVLLFIPKIGKVTFYCEGHEPIIRSKDSDKWCISDLPPADIDERIRLQINDEIEEGDSKIPEKYKDFYKTTIKFACQIEGRRLVSVENANLYCYLPAKKAHWGFDFLMNTDMVPNGARDDIEDIELNHEIAKIAGRQFFYWIKTLIEQRKYELNSVFALIPDYDKCIERHSGYKKFITEFQDEFEQLIKETPFVPVVNGEGRESYVCIDQIIDDRTDISKDNVMSDKDFVSLVGLSEHCLPIQELRESSAFKNFLFKHSPGSLTIAFDDIKKKCSDESFMGWLKNDINNNRFINHLLNKGQLENFSSEDIFIEYKGDLFSANDLYYDFDSHCSSISFLRLFIPHLAQSTRDFFEGNALWYEYAKVHFKQFDPNEMLNRYVFECEDAVKLMENISNSMGFFRFVAENDVDLTDKTDKFPYINEDGQAVFGFDGLVYFFDENSYQLSQSKWLGDNSVKIVSHEYFSDDIQPPIKSVFERLGVICFKEDEFIRDCIVGNDCFRGNINMAIENDFDINSSFLLYMFRNRELLKDKEGQLKNYVLRCLDTAGNEVYLNADDIRYFDSEPFGENTSYKDNTHHKWIDAKLMYSLHNDYFKLVEGDNKKVLESFLRQSFGVMTFTNKSFFNDVVCRNRKDIFTQLNEASKIVAFVEYLQRDSKTIFDSSFQLSMLEDMPLLSYDNSSIIERNNETLCEYDETLAELSDKSWSSQASFVVVSKLYSDKLDKNARQHLKIETYSIQNAIDNLKLSNSITGKETNIDFWRWIMRNQRSISDYTKLQGLSLFSTEDKRIVCTYLYVSNHYQKDGIEFLIRRYNPQAQFVSSDYLENEEDAPEWIRLFRKLKLKSDDKAVLEAVIKNLSNINDDSAVTVLTRNKALIQENWDEYKDKLKFLKVRTRSGEFRLLSKCVVFDSIEEKTEPFRYITIGNEVAPEIYNNNKDIILLTAKSLGGTNIINGRETCAKVKIEEYVKRIQHTPEKESIHVQFVRELAKLSQTYRFDKELISDIEYITKNGKYLKDEDITLGSAYRPSCDFEGNCVNSLNYLSDEYLDEGDKDIVIDFFKDKTQIHKAFQKNDIKLLNNNRQFAIYYWNKCFSKQTFFVKNWIEEHCFDEVRCIPTKNSIAKPGELYSPEIIDYACCCPGFEEKVPLKDIVDRFLDDDRNKEMFFSLPFSDHLDFTDCLNYLLSPNASIRETEKEKRTTIINWILRSDSINDEAVESYREQENALWRNCKGQKTQIKALSVIHPSAEQQRKIFSGNENLIQTTSFPNDVGDFERFCKLMRIRMLFEKDFVSTPVNEKDETEAILKELAPKLLILAAIENENKYQQLFEEYVGITESFRYYTCQSIELGCGNIRNDLERVFVDNDKKSFYYVDSWYHMRTYSKFCNRLKKILGISTIDDICEDVLDGSKTIDYCIEKYCNRFLNDAVFRSYLEKLNHTVKSDYEDEGDYEEISPYYEAAGDEPLPEYEMKEANPEHGVDEVSGEFEFSTETTQVSTQTPNETEPFGNVLEKSSPKLKLTTLPSRPTAPNSNSTEEDTTTNESGLTRGENTGPQTNTGSSRGGASGGIHPTRRSTWSPREPKSYSTEDVERFKSKAIARGFDTAPASEDELEKMNKLLGVDMTAEEVADTNYLAQLRMYKWLCEHQFEPEEAESDFIQSEQKEQKLKGGKYVHKCSAAGGILFISPSIWEKVSDERCVVLAYLGNNANEFAWLTREELEKWIGEDDILIKLTGEDKYAAIDDLYSHVLKGVTGKAYTLIRMANLGMADSLFAPIEDNDNQEENMDDY